MDTLKPSQAQSTLFQSDSTKYGRVRADSITHLVFQRLLSTVAISTITLHDATTSPVMSLAVDQTSSEVSIKFPIQDTMEYIQDPEDSRQRRNSPVSSDSMPANKELPLLLLKIQAREGLRLSFELTGHILDSVQPWPGAQTGTEEPNLDLDKCQAQDCDQDHAIGKEQHTTGPNDRDLIRQNLQSIATLENRGNAILTPSDNEVTSTNAGPCVTTTPNEISTKRYAPTIYFAETQTEQSMHDLCSEIAFQQQLLESPGSISIVQSASLSENNPPSKVHSWEWIYESEDRSERRSQSHKAVFGFMARNHSTGALEILSMFSLWIQHGPDSTVNNGVRSSSTPQNNSAWNARHWRRISTPEKNSNASRLPSFWSRLPAFPPSHSSLPSLQQEAPSRADKEKAPSRADKEKAPPRVDKEKALDESFVPIRISSQMPLANGTEDGPLFRATVVECEQHIRNMKNASKRILKAAYTVLETRKAWLAAEEAFAKELELMRPAESLVDQYWRPVSEHLAEQSEMLSQHMRDLLIEPFTRFYGVDIKAAELHRKAFEEESKEYYSFLSRYMGMKQDNTQKKRDADAKHEKRKRNFELKRLEYWNFLIDMRAGGSKGDELCLHLTNYTEKHCQNVTDMGVIAGELQSSLSAIVTANKQRQERNIGLQGANGTSTTSLPLYKPFGRNSAGLVLAPTAPSTASNASLDSPRTPYFERDSFDLQLEPEVVVHSSMYSAPHNSNGSTQSITGIRDLEHQDIDAGLALGRRKEGFLFATSRPSTHGGTVLEKPNINWHKYWCVLSEGQLHEYSHWKKGVTQPHIDPINLRIATVRSCRDQDRRFCFEVITPKFRRVYQAMNADEMNSWISVISNAIQGLLNGTSSCRNLNLEYMSSGYKVSGSPDGKGLMAGLSGMTRPSVEQVLNATSLPTSLQDRVLPGQAFGRKRGGNAVDGLNELGQIIQPIAAQANLSGDDQKDSNQLGVKLLCLMREQHSANTVCADCGAKNPDWCVINLGILVCIECSGIHRSLGTHISKVRSLNLDTTSYTKDLFEFIRSVGNNVSNEIWEANLAHSKDQQQELGSQEQTTKVIFRKPVVNDPREYKIAFIRKKYAERAFMNQQQYPGTGDKVSRATDALFRAVAANDIPAAITAFVAGANVNAVQRADNECDSGPFVEQDSSPVPTAQQKNTEDTLNSGDNPNTMNSPTPEESVLQPSALDDSTTSETSSQLSRSTESYAVSMTDRNEEVTSTDQRPVGTLEIRPRPLGGRPISSVMVLQTTPLLIALRHGVPFTLEEGFEVYPLAEFLMQNGAASNMSMEVKLLNAEPATALMEPSGPTHMRKVSRVKPEEFPEGMIERDAPLQTSSSIGSRLSAGTSSTGPAAVSPGRASLRSSESNDAEVDKTANRRSVGQIVELRGEDGVSAMEYLRSKGIARGDLAPITVTSPPVVATSNINASAPIGNPYWKEGAKLRPSSLKDMNIASMSTPSMSSVLTNGLTLTPRLRSSRSITTASDSTTGSSTANNGDGSTANQRDHRILPPNPLTSYPPPARYNNQDIATLFQKRRGSDSGTGSGFFSSMKASSFSVKDKEKAAAKAHARRSGDFSMFRPPSMMSSLSQHSEMSTNTGISHYTESSPAAETGSSFFPEGYQLSSDATEANNGSMSIADMTLHPDSNGDISNGGTPSRTQKVKASLTKSIRLSARYIRGSVIKDDSKAKSKGDTQSGISMSAPRLDSDDEDMGGDGEELTMAELLALQDQNPNQKGQQRHNILLHPSTATNRISSKSFFSSMSFSSTPNLSQKQQQPSSGIHS
ncbi:hypothetical protein BGZ80_004584 [Entomortierella chlamydospora]|uniref:Arf gtpase activator n=1 Tax=Entomortierella chlamydospora TaxID=101097 RepID=A0A9P6N1A7_9FUNG|nr:hypothetical protein BGZ80_004584 [Entomortierella chlamydospora]